MDHYYERLLAFTRDAVYRYRLSDETILMANQAFVRLLDLDCKPEDVVGRPLRELLEYAQPEADLRRVMASTSEARGLEHNFRTLKGYERWVLHDSFIAEKGPSGECEVVAIARDITDQKLVELALRESEQRYRRLFEESPVSLWLEDFSAVKAHVLKIRAAGITDLRTYLASHPEVVARCASMVRVIAVNQATLTLYMARNNESLLGNLREVLTEESLPVFCEQIIALAEGRTLFSGESVNRTLSGEKKNISLKWIVAPGHESRADQIMVAVTDITDLKNAQSAVEKLNATLEQRVSERTRQLEAANQELESFAYSVSHDLRAPLRSIDGFSLAIMEDCGDLLDEQGKDHLRRVRAAAQRMAEFIDSMLKLSRATRPSFGVVPLDLAPIIRTIAQDLTRAAPDRKVEWKLPEKLAVSCEPRLMETAVRNLMENAWKFTGTRANTQIEIGLTKSRPPTQTTCEGLAFYIRDNGVGFDMAYADRLFGAFQRLHSADAFPGAGIGLATVKRIVNRHGGQAWAESKPDEGATFYVWLPDNPEDKRGIAGQDASRNAMQI